MWTLIGNERPRSQLALALAGGNLPHALVLEGPPGVGRLHLAREVAQALNCLDADPPCGVCLHCRQIAVQNHPDVWLVEPRESRDSILIEQVRELRESAALRAFQGRQKVYIIRPAELLTPPAADALLKTLEEPHEQVTIILIAADAALLPATIVSRCRVVTLAPVATGVIREMLERDGAEPAEADRIARLAQGRPGWARRALQDTALLEQQEGLIATLSTVLDLGAGARLDLGESLTAGKRDRAQVRGALELLTLLGRDLLLLSLGLTPRLATGAAAETLSRQAARLTNDRLTRHFRQLRLAMERIDANVDPRLALEALFLNAP